MSDAKASIEFGSDLRWGIFEMALENRLLAIRKFRNHDEFHDPPEVEEELLVEMLDRAQRKRRGNRDEQPLRYEFYNSAELTTGLSAVLYSVQLTEDHGVPDGRDKKRVLRVAGGLAVDIEDRHPDDDIMDAIDIESGVES